MSTIAFLIDESMMDAVADALHKLDPAIEVRFINDGIAPDKGTKDPDVLVFAEQNQMALVTNDVSSMPVHVANHLAMGRHIYGVMYFPDQSLSPGRIADELLVVWACSSAEEWIDNVDYFPW